MLFWDSWESPALSLPSFLWWPSVLGLQLHRSLSLLSHGPLLFLNGHANVLDYWIRAHPNDLILNWLHPQRLHFQIRAHSQALRVGLRHIFWGVTVGSIPCTNLCWADIQCEWDSNLCHVKSVRYGVSFCLSWPTQVVDWCQHHTKGWR